MSSSFLYARSTGEVPVQSFWYMVRSLIHTSKSQRTSWQVSFISLSIFW